MLKCLTCGLIQTVNYLFFGNCGDCKNRVEEVSDKLPFN